jgi:hypothetical protein
MSTAARILVWLGAAGAAAWALDRLLVAAELRGWILYRLTPRPRHEYRRAAGSALIGLDGLFRPAARHVAEVTQEAAVHREADDEGDGGPGRPRRPAASVLDRDRPGT